MSNLTPDGRVPGAARAAAMVAGDARRKAKANGVMTYTSTRPCRKGHMAPRYTSGGNCSLCRRIRVVGKGHMAERAKALAEGHQYYQTGRPCKRGHVDWRTTINGNCVPCAEARDAARDNAARIRRGRAANRAALALECV